MPLQGNLFSEPDVIPNGGKKLFTGKELRDKGMEKAVAHANKKIDSWSERAFEFLTNYIKTHKRFLAEDIRIDSKRIVPEPPSSRAWGSVIVKAAKAGLINQIGYRKVTNPMAHKTPAAFWETV